MSSPPPEHRHAPSTNLSRAARHGLLVLTLINLFNYLDRYVIASLVEPLKASELALNDQQIGWLMSSFILVYMLASPVFGVLGDRHSRPRLIAAGVAVWSIATAAGGLAVGFLSLLVARSLVGIGEAAYGTIAPAVLADYFPASRRGRIFSIFFCAIPVGSALGYILGGTINAHFGWRAAFFTAGIPGILLSLLVLRVVDPPRGAQDEPTAPGAGQAGFGSYLRLARNLPYLLTILGYAAYTFGLGGLAAWMPAFLERVRGVPAAQASVVFGGIIVATGFVGTAIGGKLGDHFLPRSPRAYLWVSAIATLCAVPFAALALMSPVPALYWSGMVMAELLLFASTGPINSMVVNLVNPFERAAAVGMCNFTIHILGDVPSPILIGTLSRTSSLQHAVLVVPFAVAIAGAVWIIAALVAAKTASHAQAA